jgi:hypothetical protein
MCVLVLNATARRMQFVTDDECVLFQAGRRSCFVDFMLSAGHFCSAHKGQKRMYSVLGAKSRPVVLLFSITGLIAACGCGSNSKYTPGKLVRVSGNVTLEGKPLSKGTVYFAPEKSDLLISPEGKIDDSGNYELKTGGKDGAPLGKFKVFVNLTADFEKEDATPENVNRSFLSPNTSPLSITVVETPEDGAYDVKLTE